VAMWEHLGGVGVASEQCKCGASIVAALGMLRQWREVDVTFCNLALPCTPLHVSSALELVLMLLFLDFR